MSKPQKPLIVRDATDADMSDIQAIYAHHVQEGTASFEEVTPDLGEMMARRDAILGLGLPYLVAELDGRVRGYAYAGRFRPRSAYRHTVEDSIYVAPDATGLRIGSTLLKELIKICEHLKYRQMIAVIGGSANAASIALHRSMGFESAGTLKSTGFKHGRWVDTVLMQRALGQGDSSLP